MTLPEMHPETADFHLFDASAPPRFRGVVHKNLGRPAPNFNAGAAYPPRAMDRRVAGRLRQAAAAAASPVMTRPPSPAVTSTFWPSWMRPSRICVASEFCSERWMTRLSGRAP